MTLFTENSKEFLKTIRANNKFNKSTGYKISIKNELYFYTLMNNKKNKLKQSRAKFRTVNYLTKVHLTNNSVKFGVTTQVSLSLMASLYFSTSCTHER